MKSYTDIEQSKKLAEILPLESADMHYINDKHAGCVPYLEMTKGSNPWLKGVGVSPCWSLAALISVLPEGVIERYYVPNIQKEHGKYSIAYGAEELLCIADNPIDACYEMIIKLNELKML